MSGALRIIGADPGLSGALALYVPALGTLQVEDMPTFELKKGKTTKRFIDYASLARILDAWCGGDNPPIAFVEKVSSMPAQGIASAFDFGRSYGALLMGLYAQFIRVEDALPTVWKRAVGIPTGAGKDESRFKAANVFPRHAGFFARKKDDGRAEASLIAHYGAAKIASALS